MSDKSRGDGRNIGMGWRVRWKGAKEMSVGTFPQSVMSK
jgi:hypothetical protein